MPLDYSRPASVVPPPSLARNFGLLLLRLTAGGSLLFWYGGREALTAWSHIWHKTPWGLPAQLNTLGFPLALPIGLTLVILTLLGSFFMVIGLLTRLSSIAMGLVATVTAFLFTAHPEIEEQALLYTGLCFAISLCGPGMFAMDQVLKATTSRRP
jgi:uncharacterized membrane protein YphA (DoxX/SURF4 family)